MRKRPMNTRVDHLHLPLTRQVGDVTLTCFVALCSWNSGEGVTLVVEFEGGGKAHIREPELDVEDATDADYQRMLDSVQLAPCKTCGGPAFDPTWKPSNRDGECEKCFLGKLDAELEQGLAEEAEELAKMDARYKAQGYTHRIEGWVHRDDGDRQISLWLQNPTKQQIQAELKRSGSLDLTDYKTIEL